MFSVYFERYGIQAWDFKKYESKWWFWNFDNNHYTEPL